MAPLVERIDHVHVFVADRPAAEQSYANVLGLTRVDSLVGWALNGGPLTLSNPSGSIHLAFVWIGRFRCGRFVVQAGVGSSVNGGLKPQPNM